MRRSPRPGRSPPRRPPLSRSPGQGPELLQSRVLLWLVVGVTMFSVTGLVAGFVSLA